MDSFTLKVMASPEIENIKGGSDSPTKPEDNICLEIEQVDFIENRSSNFISHIEINPLSLSEETGKEVEKSKKGEHERKEGVNDEEEEGKDEITMRGDEGGGMKISKSRREVGVEGKNMDFRKKEREEEEKRDEDWGFEDREENDWDFELSLDEEEADDISEERSKVEYLPEDGIKRLIMA